MTAPAPRFSASSEARGRLRLIAAVGMLALAALATGGIASLTQEPRAASTDLTRPGEPSSSGGVELLDPTASLERRVHEAERSAARARSAIRRARQQGVVDPALLDELEARLEHLAESPLDSIRRTYGQRERSAPQTGDEQRPHIRPLATESRDL